MRELFVYYKVRRDLSERAHLAAVGLQDACRQRWRPLSARLLRRDDVPGGNLETWMEHYAVDSGTTGAAAGGVTPEMEAWIELEATAHRALIDGRRHVEVFFAFGLR